MWILKKRYEDLKETEKISSAFKTTINNLEDENKNSNKRKRQNVRART